MKVTAYSDVGGRSNNEDAYLVKANGNRLLLCVADGLGGIDAGELASAEAKNALSFAPSIGRIPCPDASRIRAS